MTSSESIQAQLLEHELRLMQPETRSDPELAGELIASDFREIGASGRLYGRDDVLRAMADEPPREVPVIADFSARELVPNVVLVTYRTGSTLRSSIWRLRAEQWMLVFHQGTPAQGE